MQPSFHCRRADCHWTAVQSADHANRCAWNSRPWKIPGE